MWWKLWRKHWQGLLIEMFAVFIGVSAAFALDSYRENSEKNERRMQVVKLLYQDVLFIETNMENGFKRYESSEYFGGFLTQYENGEMPEVKFFLFPDVDQTMVWMSLLQSGGNQAISIDTLSALERFMIAAELGRETNRQFSQIMLDLVLPQVNQPTSYFYEPGSTKLKKSYGWIPYYLKQSKDHFLFARSELQNLKVALEKEMQQ